MARKHGKKDDGSDDDSPLLGFSDKPEGKLTKWGGIGAVATGALAFGAWIGSFAFPPAAPILIPLAHGAGAACAYTGIAAGYGGAIAGIKYASSKIGGKIREKFPTLNRKQHPDATTRKIKRKGLWTAALGIGIILLGAATLAAATMFPPAAIAAPFIMKAGAVVFGAGMVAYGAGKAAEVIKDTAKAVKNGEELIVRDPDKLAQKAARKQQQREMFERAHEEELGLHSGRVGRGYTDDDQISSHSSEDLDDHHGLGAGYGGATPPPLYQSNPNLRQRSLTDPPQSQTLGSPLSPPPPALHDSLQAQRTLTNPFQSQTLESPLSPPPPGLPPSSQAQRTLTNPFQSQTLGSSLPPPPNGSQSSQQVIHPDLTDLDPNAWRPTMGSAEDIFRASGHGDLFPPPPTSPTLPSPSSSASSPSSSVPTPSQTYSRVPLLEFNAAHNNIQFEVVPAADRGLTFRGETPDGTLLRYSITEGEKKSDAYFASLKIGDKVEVTRDQNDRIKLRGVAPARDEALSPTPPPQRTVRRT